MVNIKHSGKSAFSMLERGDVVALLGDIEFSVVEQDDISLSAEITDKPVENGQDISDHVKPEPDKLSIKGIITGYDAPAKWSKLKMYNKTGEILTYVNRTIYDNVVIESFNSVHSRDIINGYKFNMTLKQVRIAKPHEISITQVPPKTKKKVQTKVKKKQKAGKKQPKKGKAKKPDKKAKLLAKLRALG